MTQEKLEQRARPFWNKGYLGGQINFAIMADFARAEIQRAVEIALEQDESDCTECRGCGTVIAAKIRKLMD